MSAAESRGEDREESDAPLRVAIIGAGGVGLGIGSCLANAGARVLFVVRREETARALHEHGLARSGVFGAVEIPADRLEADTRYATLGSFEPDSVLVCTKTTACEEVAETLAASCGARFREMHRPPMIVLCMNGWGNAERFAARFPARQIFNARVITGFRSASPWQVEVTVHAEAIHIGSLYLASGEHEASGEHDESRESDERVARLCRTIAAGGIPCAPSPSIAKDLIAKLLYNCALNPLAALRGVRYGALGEDLASRTALEAIVREIFSVLDATGLETHWRTADDYLGYFFATLLPPTREHESSMLQDLRAGKRTEIDALCGAVVALGRAAGAATPVNDALATLVRATERAC